MAARGLRLVAVYGGAQMSKQIAALEAGAEVVVAPGRLIDLIDRKVADLAAGRDGRARRGRPYGRHGLHAPGRVAAAPHSGHRQRRCSLPPSTVASRAWSTATSTTPCSTRSARRYLGRADEHRFLLVHEMDQPKVAAAISHSATRTLVFVNTKRAADRVARALVGTGVDARRSTATCGRRPASGRSSASPTAASPYWSPPTWRPAGDIDQLDIVIQADPPPDPKTYLHRSGPYRPGRRRRPGRHARAVEPGTRGRRLKRRLSLDEPIVEMFSNDERLADLTSWKPAAEGAA